MAVERYATRIDGIAQTPSRRILWDAWLIHLHKKNGQLLGQVRWYLTSVDSKALELDCYIFFSSETTMLTYLQISEVEASRVIEIIVRPAGKKADSFMMRRSIRCWSHRHE